MHKVSAAGLIAIEGLNVCSKSVATARDAEFGSTPDPREPALAILAPAESSVFDLFEGTTRSLPQGTLLTGPHNPHNAEAIRKVFSWLRPSPLGLRTSAGFGDRLGLATPGHIRAMRSVGGDLAPIFAQQSIREMERTGRSAQQVLDDAMWDVFASGWRDGYGADADHLKTTHDIDVCVSAGYTFYTFDPGDHVGHVPTGISMPDLQARFRDLPWSELDSSPEVGLRRFSGKHVEFEDYRIAFDDRTVMRAAVKYSRALAHVQSMHTHLTALLPEDTFEIEISVDETDDPTSHAEHIFIASELRRLGVTWVSLAPRFIGQFEKGVDYIGSVDEFDVDFAVHAAIARHFGPYKLSLHSGSDKFSIYASAASSTRGCIHLKTAGTSFLEALRVVARHDPALFRRLYQLARARFETDRASYHVSARLDRASRAEHVADDELAGLLDQLDARQVLHVTFGSLLTGLDDASGISFGEEILTVLRAHPESYAETLQRHFHRHLGPFAHCR
ncbi:MAG: hypothetical protein H0T72_14605 [Chloroflexia bacterium]|nr:hypothetical protein [Chloroflexia bacterium]